jgi:hypothetical protein
LTFSRLAVLLAFAWSAYEFISGGAGLLFFFLCGFLLMVIQAIEIARTSHQTPRRHPGR